MHAVLQINETRLDPEPQCTGEDFTVKSSYIILSYSTLCKCVNDPKCLRKNQKA